MESIDISLLDIFVRDSIDQIRYGVDKFNENCTTVKCLYPEKISFDISLPYNLKFDILLSLETQDGTENRFINSSEYKQLLKDLEGFPRIAKDIMYLYSINTLSDLPLSQYYKVRYEILRIKTLEDHHLKKD